LWASQV